MLTVVIPAAATALTTVEHVRQDLGLAPEKPTDAHLERLIEYASRVIVDYCRQPFAMETVRETFETPMRSGAVMLGRAPVAEMVEVTLNSAVIASPDYRYDPATGLMGLVHEDGFPVYGWDGWLIATYRAGYVLPSDESPPTLPEPVERAGIRLVGAYLSLQSRDPLVKSETTEGVGATSWYVPGAASILADPEAEQLLRPYRRLF